MGKSNTKQGKMTRAVAWNNVQLELEDRTGKHFEIKQLQKKWNNIQSRVKERLRTMKITGGGSYVPGTANDTIAKKK